MMSFKKFPTFILEGKDINAPFLISSLISGVIGLIFLTLSLLELVDMFFLDSPLYDFYYSLSFVPGVLLAAALYEYLRNNLQIRYYDFKKTDMRPPYLIVALISGVIGTIFLTLSLLELVDMFFLDSPFHDFYCQLVFVFGVILVAFVYIYLINNLKKN